MKTERKQFFLNKNRIFRLTADSKSAMHRRLSPEAIPPLFLMNKGIEFEAPRSIFGLFLSLNLTFHSVRFSQLHTPN